MESRFWGFGRSKRGRPSSAKSELEFQSIAYASAAAPNAEPILIHQPLGKSSRESRRLDDQGTLLKGFAYDSQPSGKPPQQGGKVSKGNGPVKLQTSRRLSSGDLFVTTQRSQRTLEDIREGDYVVGQKSKPNLTIQTPNNKEDQTSIDPRRVVSLRTRPQTARPTTTSKESNWTFLPPLSPTRNITFPIKTALPAAAGNPTSPAIETAPSPQATPTSLDSPSQSASVTPLEPSLSVAALWRAEHGRLAKLYGHDEADRNPLQNGKPTSTGKSGNLSPHSLTQPDLDSEVTKRASGGSSRSSAYHDDASDFSSHDRKSTATSSTYTTQNSVYDGEPLSTRENIRKTIDDMRSNYLLAIEAQSPTVAKKKSTKRRKKPGPTSSPHRASHLSVPDRQTWHGQDTTFQSIDEQLLRRTTSHSVQGHKRLPPVEASPSRTDRTSDTDAKAKPIRDLKRADSMTLGGLMLGIPESPHDRSETWSINTSNKEPERRSSTDSDGNDLLSLRFPTAQLMPDSFEKTAPVVAVNELTTPRYIPTTAISSRPVTAPVNTQILLSSFPKIPPSRPIPPPVSLAELVNFI